MMEAFRVFSETGRMFSPQVEELLKNNAFLIGREGRNSREAIHHFRETLRGKRVYETLKKMHDTSVLDRFIPEFGRIRHLVILEAFPQIHTETSIPHSQKNMENSGDSGNRNSRALPRCSTGEPELLLTPPMLFQISKGVPKARGSGLLIIRAFWRDWLMTPRSGRQ
jgi:UTP:GlnB (protein PII) uridylyltransferase